MSEKICESELAANDYFMGDSPMNRQHLAYARNYYHMKVEKRVLLIDDDLDDRTLFCEALAEFFPNFNCETVEDGVKCVELLSQQKSYDYIFLDLNLPKMDGFQVLQYLRDNNLAPGARIVVLSSTSRQSDIDRCFQLGVSSFFTKPSTYFKLVETIKEALNFSPSEL
jgi:CheY-like chemotaxis protein